MALPLLAAAGIGLGSSLLGGALGSRAGRQTKYGKQLQNRYLSAMGGQEGRANRAEDYYLDEAMGFDPSAAMREYGEAAYGDFRRNLTRDVGELGGRAVGAGRLDTGFYDVDQGELVSDLASRYQEAISSKALEASGLDLRRIEGVGSYGQGARNTYLDLLAGERDREMAERNAKRQMWAGAFGSGMGTAATFYGAGR